MPRACTSDSITLRQRPIYAQGMHIRQDNIETEAYICPGHAHQTG